MVSVRQRSADFVVRYAIVEADRQGVTGPNGEINITADDETKQKTLNQRWFNVGPASQMMAQH